MKKLMKKFDGESAIIFALVASFPTALLGIGLKSAFLVYTGIMLMVISFFLLLVLIEFSYDNLYKDILAKNK